jgi:hypothetical protein
MLEPDKQKQNPKGGQRKPREIRELVLEIAKLAGFGYSRSIGKTHKIEKGRYQPAYHPEHSQSGGDRASAGSDVRQVGKLPGTSSEHAVSCGFVFGEVGDAARHPGSVCVRVPLSA